MIVVVPAVLLVVVAVLVGYHVDRSEQHRDPGPKLVVSSWSAVPFDQSVPLFFPSLASLPIEQVRRAVAEYFQTGRRPDCVQRQPGDWY
ncbi:Imm1 family immunity protein [Actinoalloteichus caeruleus]|uniref:Imm1 family immunity protein n=1 Tax=Actinoalloteichus cyanogriseus TaxID=2893586 RepID=UPI0004AA9911|nr:Imm1 family immunity protein [Actinoalloteichus caeruleus]